MAEIYVPSSTASAGTFRKGVTFHKNGISWEILDRFESWIFCKGIKVFPTGPHKEIYDCANINSGPDGTEEVNLSLGVTGYIESNLDAFTKQGATRRFNEGIEKRKDAKQRIINTLQHERDLLSAEQKRQDFLSAMESQKRHLLEEFHDLYDKSEKPEGVLSNKRCQDIMLKVAGYDAIRFYYKNPIYKL